MSQYNFAPLDADSDDGTKLVADLNSWVPAVLSTHAGTTRPTYVRQGMLWVDNSASPEIVLNLFDGVLDRELARVAPSGTVTSGEQATVWSEVVPGHNFDSCIAVYHNGTSWLRARADNEATMAQAMVRTVSGTRVTFQNSGLFEGTDGLAPGGIYYLSATAAGVLTTVRPTTGFVQSIMAALDSTRGIVSVGQSQAVDGVVLLRPAINQNVIQSKDPDGHPLYLQRRADQRAGLLALLDSNGTGIGGIDSQGRPWGSLAPAVADSIPAGAFIYWFGTAPAGWIEANGQAIPTVYTILRAKFGANMPDWRGRFVIAAGPGFALGSGGGAYSVALAATHMPNELQIQTSVGLVSRGINGDLVYNSNKDVTGMNLTGTAYRGNSTPISIVPPYAALTLICKLG